MPHILVVEDNLADEYLIRQAIAVSGVEASIHVVRDGQQATQFLDAADAASGPGPALVILDINLPKKPGTAVLDHLRRSGKCQQTIVIMVSSSDTLQDRQEALRRGANEYFPKPPDYDAFMKLGDLIRKRWQKLPAGGE